MVSLQIHFTLGLLTFFTGILFGASLSLTAPDFDRFVFSSTALGVLVPDGFFLGEEDAMTWDRSSSSLSSSAMSMLEMGGR